MYIEVWPQQTIYPALWTFSKMYGLTLATGEYDTTYQAIYSIPSLLANMR